MLLLFATIAINDGANNINGITLKLVALIDSVDASFMQDSSEIISQMGSFAASLLQINETLQALSASSDNVRADHAALREQLIDSREDLLDTLITLNKMMMMTMTTSMDAYGRSTVTTVDGNRSAAMYTGSLLLAPRLFNSSMCFDFAIAVSISTSSCNQADIIQRSTASPQCLDQGIEVLWVHPQSSYECYSQGISFAESQLRSSAMAIRCWDYQRMRLEKLKEGQRVMYRQHSRMAFYHRIEDADKGDNAYRCYMAPRTDSSDSTQQLLDPIWIVGEVDYVDSGRGGPEAAVAYISVPSRTYCPGKAPSSSSSLLLLCCKLDGTCLFPVPTTNDEVLWRRGPGADEEEEELSSASEEDDVSDLPPMAYRAPDPPARTAALGRSHSLGDWEQHTRGEGTALRSRDEFGY